MEQLNKFFQNKTIKTILDVGTGPGNFIPELLEAMPNVKVTGVDPNVGSLDEARQKYQEFEFNEMLGEKLDFSDNAFDAAAVSMALHHLPDVAKTLGEMQRVVKPGGFIIVNELFSDNLNPAQNVHKRMHHFRSKIDRLNGVSHNATFTKKEILALIETAGLEIDLHFENTKAQNKPAPDEIAERKEKLLDMLDGIKDFPEFQGMSKEVPEIETELDLHGFQMATCVVAVATVN